MRRTLALLIAIPTAIILVLLAVANRAPVTLSLDPFAREVPAVSFTAPFFVFLLLAAMAGVLLGGIATWLRQGRHRRLERQYRRDAERYRSESENLKGAMSATAQVASPAQLPSPAR
jgi:uncharacterized integral membrane protein